MWKIYESLIEGIPEGIKTEQVYMGNIWTVVKAGCGIGAALTVNETGKQIRDAAEYSGKDLKDLGALIKSWDFMEASIGAAAVNAYYNSRVVIEKTGGRKLSETTNTFDDYKEATRGKKVAVIGHFVHVDTFCPLAEQVSVLERRPSGNDYPDSACEYVLPDQDFVFITGSAIVNKTLPRLLELSEKARTIVTGPTTTMSQLLFDYGADELSGLVINDFSRDDIIKACNGDIRLPRCGKRIRIFNE